MTNREFRNKKISDMTRAEQMDAIVMAKSLLEIVMKNMTEYEKEKVLNSIGCGEIALILNTKMH